MGMLVEEENIKNERHEYVRVIKFFSHKKEL